MLWNAPDYAPRLTFEFEDSNLSCVKILIRAFGSHEKRVCAMYNVHCNHLKIIEPMGVLAPQINDALITWKNTLQS